MRLAGLVEHPNHVCCRYRLRAFAQPFATVGHDLQLQQFPRGIWNRFQIGTRLGHIDAVILQRRLLSRIEVGLLRRRVQRLLFDFDDAVWLRDSYAAKGFDSTRRRVRFRAIVSRCDMVVAGNAFLAAEAARWSSQPRVEVIPTCVDVEQYAPAEHAGPAGTATLVWIGSASTLRGLEAVRPTLESIGRHCPGVRLKLICDRFVRFGDLPVIDCNWTETSEAAQLAASDIGISWVPDDPWSRGKCGLKVLQYMAAGLPVVANPVGVQAEMVRDGATGFLAGTEAEWVEALRTLARDPDLRRRMGQAGRRVVEERYSVAVGARRWLALLDETFRRRIPA